MQLPVSKTLHQDFHRKYLTDSFSSIQTYNRRGVAKPGIPKNEHAIIYTGSTEPRPHPTELPQSKYEEGMLSPIRVKAKHKGILDTMSRINFGKIYTVEHNVKVFDFGQVYKEFGHVLYRQFQEVLNRRMRPTAQAVGASQTNQEVEDDDESGDDSDTSSEDETVTARGRGRRRR